MLVIFKREIRAFFSSPMAYVLIGVFILLTSISFDSEIQSGSAEIANILSIMNILLIFIVPLMTMRTIAEERKTNTEVLLLTSPVSIDKIVFGKYLALICEFLVMVALSLVFPLLQYIFRNTGNPPIAPYLIGGYVGFILVGIAFYAIGLFFSSLTENQIIAAISSVLALAIMFLMDSIAGLIGGFLGSALQWFSLFSRYQDFTAGLIGLAPIVYYLSFGGLFIFLTIRVIERRRWSQG
jgi:ABC-2 type transport system permease protein